MEIAHLTGPRTRLWWAYKHFKAVERELAAFGRQNTKTANVTCRQDGAWSVFFVNPAPVLPVQISLMAGDCLTNIRAALDHLICQLLLREDKEPCHYHQFPICETLSKFTEQVETPEMRGRRNPLHGIALDAGTIIKQSQPFNCAEPQRDAILWLANLTNINKHRDVLVQMSFVDEEAMLNNFQWVSDSQPVEHKFSGVQLSTEHETEIVRFRFAPGSHPRVNMNINVPLEPTIGYGKSHVGIGILYAA